MINLSNPPARVNKFGHPAWLLAFFFLFLIDLVLSYILGFRDYQQSEVRNSFLVGLYVGLPVNLLTKWILRKNVGLYTDYLLAELPARISSEISTGKIVYSLPLFAGVVALGAISAVEGLPSSPACFVFASLVLLWYPEQKLIYEAAKQKLDQLRSVTA